MSTRPSADKQPGDCDACWVYECRVAFAGDFRSKFHFPSKDLIARPDRDADLCILHLPDGAKNEARFADALAQKIAANDFNFRSVYFPRDVTFAGELSDADFFRATFNADAFFIDVTFAGDTIFRLANFHGAAKFTGATFSGRANFSGSTFHGREYFYQRKRYLHSACHFCDATFGGTADFWDVALTGVADFSNATFNADARFQSLVHLRQRNHVPFRERAEVKFTNCRLQRPETIRFENLDLNDFRFRGTDVTNVDFTNVEWPERLRDEVEAERLDYPLVEKLYRQLRRNYEDHRNYPAAGRFYYGELEMRRKAQQWGRFLPTPVTLYWLSCGYGQRPIRAGVWVISLFLMFAAVYVVGGLEQTSASGSVTHSVSAALLHVAEELTFVRDRSYEPVKPNGAWVGVAQRLLMPLQIGLFVMSIRRSFKR